MKEELAAHEELEEEDVTQTVSDEDSETAEGIILDIVKIAGVIYRSVMNSSNAFHL